MGSRIDDIPSNGLEPNLALIERLEHILFEARSGRVVAGALALVYRNGVVSTAWDHAPSGGSLHALSTGVNMLAHRYNSFLDRS